MAKKHNKTSRLSVVVFTVSLVFIFASLLIISGALPNIVTTITQSSASRGVPKVTERFTDNFKTDTVNEQKWSTHARGNGRIMQTASNNLRMDIPQGNHENKPKITVLTFKELIKETGDFRLIAVVYRPVVDGEGAGIAGLRFNSKGGDDDEGATIRWIVNGDNSIVHFVVNGTDGTKLESERMKLDSNIALLRLDRINRQYQAYFKPGRDLSADTGWTKLGQEWNRSLGADGRVSLFTQNTGDKFPKVTGRFDSAHIGWEGEPSANDTATFSDAFANGNLGVRWKELTTKGAQIYENDRDNLIMSLASGQADGKRRSAVLYRLQPNVLADKDFRFHAQIFKPTVVGEGKGEAGLRFSSAGNVNDEGASVRWIADAGNLSRLSLMVRNPDGTIAEKAGVNMDPKVKKLTVRLVRTGTNDYRGWYRIGDGDGDFVLIGSYKTSDNFGANGKVQLYVTNRGDGGKFPRVVARFDRAWGSMEK